MRILQLVKWLSPNENSGGKIRAYRLGELLAGFADVDVAGFLPDNECLDGTDQQLSFYRRLFPIPLKKSFGSSMMFIPSVFKGRSLRSSRFYHTKYCAMAVDLVARNHYDAIQVEELPMASMIEGLTIKQPVVYSAYNVESDLSASIFENSNTSLRFLAKMEKRRTRMEEVRALERAAFCLAVSSNDKVGLETLCVGEAPPIYVIPNCADDRFCPSSSSTPKKEIIVLGSFGWRPNAQGILWFIEHVLPRLKERLPDCSVRIVGSEIGDRLSRKLHQRGCCTHENVSDILPFLQEARVSVVPLQVGGGTRIKIVQAWAAGLPVVSTETGAEGLRYDAGSDMLVANDPEEFAGLVHDVITDDDLYRRLRIGGLRRAQELRWSNFRRMLETIYESEIERLGSHANRRQCASPYCRQS
jgi:polysaccharide biosynthesis protein PslH